MALAAGINMQPIKKFRTLQTKRLTIGILAMGSQPIAPRTPRNAGSPVSPQRFPELSFQTRGFGVPISIAVFYFPLWHVADRFDNGRRPIRGTQAAVSMRIARRSRVNESGWQPIVHPTSAAVNAERPRDEEMASGRILSALQEN
jgi:hypothetical protein